MILDILILAMIVIFPVLLIAGILAGSHFIGRERGIQMKEHFQELGISVTECSRFRIKGELRGQRFEYHQIKESKEPLRAYLEIYHTVPLNLGLRCRDRSWDSMITIFVLSLLGAGKKVVLPYLEELGLDCFAKNKEGSLELLGREEVSGNIQRLVNLLGQRALDETVSIDDKKICISYYLESWTGGILDGQWHAELPRKEGIDAMVETSAALGKGAGFGILR